MATMAEIEEGYPERRAALVAALGTMTLAEFGENLAAGLRNARPAISIGEGWLPVTDARLQLRPLAGPGLDPLVFGPQAGDASRVTGLAELGARLLEWARQVIADIGRALRPLLDAIRSLAPVATVITGAHRERLSAMHREYHRRQRARRRRR